MRKRRESDHIQQRNAARRSLLLAQNPREFDITKIRKCPRRIGSRQVVTAPEELSFFDENYEDFCKFIVDIKSACAKGLVLLDLKPIRTFKVSALLVLYANIESMQRVHRNPKIIKSTACSSSSVGKKFQMLGFWDLMRENRPKFQDARSAGVPICTASYVDKQMGVEQSQLRSALVYVKRVFDATDAGEQGGLAFAAITESVSNVWQHGYADGFDSAALAPELKNWWIVVEHISDQLFIGVYDMGVGIPATLAIKHNARDMLQDAYGAFKKLLGMKGFTAQSYRDAASIKAAVDYGRSRFNTSGRGKGLSEAKDFVMANPMGTLMIYSGSGWYQYATKDEVEEAEPLPFEFEGTLIQWNIKLNVPR